MNLIFSVVLLGLMACGEKDDTGEAAADTAADTEVETGPEIGGECVDSFGAEGFYDCSGECYDNDVLSFVGDTFCDDGADYANLNCEEFEFDGGDC